MDLIVVGAQKLRDRVADFKSPLIPLPNPDVGDPSSSSTMLLTERTLYERHREWKMRCVSLWIRQTALLEAKARQFDTCWAGTVDRKTIKATKAAIVEAKWVETRLAEALEWCEDRERRRVPLEKVVVASKKHGR